MVSDGSLWILTPSGMATLFPCVTFVGIAVSFSKGVDDSDL